MALCAAGIMLFIAKMFLMEYVDMIVDGTLCSKMSSIVKMFLMSYVGMIVGHGAVWSRDNAIHC